MQLSSWKKEHFEVAVLGGSLEAVDGVMHKNFGVYVGSEDRAYLVHLASGNMLSVFADQRIAFFAARIVEGLGDCSDIEPPCADVIAAAWMDAGLYVNGEHDATGNTIWHWSNSAARMGAGTA